MRERKRFILAMLVILIIIVCYPMIQQGIMCNDELMLRLWSQQGMTSFFKTTIINENISNGRILGVIGNLKFISYISDNKYIFRTIGVLVLLSALGLFGYIIYRMSKKIVFSFGITIIALIFIPITFELSVPNAYMIVCLQPLILLELSIISWIDYLKKKKKRNVIMCCCFFLWAMFLYEFIITYIFLFPCLVLIKKENMDRQSFVEAIKKTVPIVITAIIYVIMYIVQGKIFPTHYLGNVLEIPSLEILLNVLKRLFASALPGYFVLFSDKYKFLFQYYNKGKFSIDNILNPTILCFAIALLLILIMLFFKNQKTHVERQKNKFISIGIIILSFVYGFLPALPNALSPLYQSAVTNGEFISVPVSIYLYLANVFTISFALYEIGKRFQNIYLRIVLCGGILIGASAVQIENRVFSTEQSSNFERIEDIENMLQMDYWKQFGNITIDAPSLYETKNTLAVEELHWTKYAQIYGNYLTVNSSSEQECNMYIEMQKDNSFYLYWDDNNVLITKYQLNDEVVSLKTVDSQYKQFSDWKEMGKDGKYFIYLLR